MAPGTSAGRTDILDAQKSIWSWPVSVSESRFKKERRATMWSGRIAVCANAACGFVILKYSNRELSQVI